MLTCQTFDEAYAESQKHFTERLFVDRNEFFYPTTTFLGRYVDDTVLQGCLPMKIIGQFGSGKTTFAIRIVQVALGEEKSKLAAEVNALLRAVALDSAVHRDIDYSKFSLETLNLQQPNSRRSSLFEKIAEYFDDVETIFSRRRSLDTVREFRNASMVTSAAPFGSEQVLIDFKLEEVVAGTDQDLNAARVLRWLRKKLLEFISIANGMRRCPTTGRDHKLLQIMPTCVFTKAILQ